MRFYQAMQVYCTQGCPDELFLAVKFLSERCQKIILFQYWMSTPKGKLPNARDHFDVKNTDTSFQKSHHSSTDHLTQKKTVHQVQQLIQAFKHFLNNSKRFDQSDSKPHSLQSYPQIEPRDRQISVPLPPQKGEQLSFQMLDKYTTELCKVVWSRAFYYYSTDQLSLQHCKNYCSQQILKNTARLSERYRLDAEHFRRINVHLQEKVLEYMLNKYPMTLSLDINRNVNSSVREVDNTEQPCFDYLNGCSVAFRFRESGEYSDLIMRVLNQVLRKVDVRNGNSTVYERFQDKMGSLFDSVFDPSCMGEIQEKHVASQKGTPAKGISQSRLGKRVDISDQQLPRSNSIKSEQIEKYKQKVQQYTSYKIGRKIPQSTRPFSQQQIRSHNMRIQNSQVLRLLTKWCDQLQKKFTTSNYFAHYIQTLKLDNGKYVAEVTDDIKQELDRLMGEEYRGIHRDLEDLCRNNYYLQAEMLKQQLRMPVASELEKYEFIASQYSIGLVNNLNSYIITYLNRLIHGLLTVSLKLSKSKALRTSQWSSNLNLVTFQVMDLLRCKCSSGQKEILIIYRQLMKMSEGDSIKLIKVTNRLQKGTNDILINIKYMDILCEVQLAVNNKNNKFLQYSNKFNHYLYELKRSAFGPFIELTSIWKSLDSRFIYYEKVKESVDFEHHKAKNQNCACSESEYQFFYKPFLCSSCMGHYYHNNYIRHHIKCRKCHHWLCAKCQIQAMDAKTLLSPAFKNRDIIHNSSKITSKTQSIPEYGVCVFIQSQQLKVQPFRKHTNKNKTTIIGIKSKNLYQIYDISSYESEMRFRSSYLIFQIESSYGKTHIKIDDDRVRSFFIEQVLQEAFQKNKEKICLNYSNLDDQQLSLFCQKGSINQKGNIKKIEAIGNRIISTKTIADSFGKLKSLELSKNSVENFEGLGKLEGLVKLLVSQNRLKEVPLEVVSLWNLKQLSLSWNEIKTLPLQLAKLHKLKTLKLGNNKLQQISPCLSQLFYLQELSLKCNKIHAVPQSIKHLNQLVILELQNNQITSVHQGIGLLAHLQSLNISQNQLTLLPNTFQSLLALSNLNISHNKLTQLPQSINQLHSLSKLNLSNNHIQSLPPLAKLHQLSQLNLNHNSLTCVAQLNEGLAQLKLLSLSHNNLQQLPSFASFPNLEQLYLNNNFLTCLPDSMGKIEGLQILMVDHNSLGVICELKIQSLRVLNASFNKLKAFRNMDLICLEEMDLSSNQIENFSENLLPALRKLNVTDNRLQGLQISHCLKLRYVLAGSNKLENIPAFNLRNNIKVLSLQSNQIRSFLVGSNHFHTLSALNLSSNLISHLPKDMQCIQSVKQKGLDLSHNPIQRVECWDFIMRKATKSTIQSMQKTLIVKGVVREDSKSSCDSTSSRTPKGH